MATQEIYIFEEMTAQDIIQLVTEEENTELVVERVREYPAQKEFDITKYKEGFVNILYKERSSFIHISYEEDSLLYMIDLGGNSKKICHIPNWGEKKTYLRLWCDQKAGLAELMQNIARKKSAIYISDDEDEIMHIFKKEESYV